MPILALPHRLAEHAPKLISTLLLISVSLWLAWQSYRLISVVREPLPAPDEAASQPGEAPQSVSLEHLFGIATAQHNGPLPATNLQLSLLGSFVHNDPQRSSAVILRQGESAKRYTVGMEVDTGVRLEAVWTDRVELARNGRRERLSFPRANHLPASTSYADAPAGEVNPHDLLEQLSQADRDNLEQLRLRMLELRGEISTAQAPTASTPDQHTESD